MKECEHFYVRPDWVETELRTLNADKKIVKRRGSEGLWGLLFQVGSQDEQRPALWLPVRVPALR